MIKRHLNTLSSLIRQQRQDPDGSRPLALLGRFALLLAVGVLVLLGLIGLILPILPGILFLGLAALLMARLSSRFARGLHGHPGYRRWQRFSQACRGLGPWQRCRLALLLLARAGLQSLSRLPGRRQRG